MKIVSSHQEIRSLSREWHQAGRTVGLVPTMGALHRGHVSLVEASVRQCSATVVSIFVNPIQFGPEEDLDRYPRDFDGDVEKLRDVGADALFTTTPEEMYPAGFQTYVDPGALGDGLCGASRPGHFRGVATVVTKLLNLVQPHESFFGQKDYQQARILLRMVQDLNLDHRLRILPTVREVDGLAYSSRNQMLTPEQRREAPKLAAALQEVRKAFDRGERRAEQLQDLGRKQLEGSGFRLDYFEVRNDEFLAADALLEDGAVAAAAAFLGKTRLIDNVLLGSAQSRLG